MTSLVYKRLDPLFSVVAGDSSGDDRSRYVQDQFVIRCWGDIVVSFSDFNFNDIYILACSREHTGNGNESEEY